MTHTVQIENAASQLIAATRITTTRKEIGNDMGRGFGRLVAALRAASIESSGPPFVAYYDLIDDETDGDIEVCIPIIRKLSIESDVYSREIEGGDVATTTHTGPYHELAQA